MFLPRSFLPLAIAAALAAGASLPAVAQTATSQPPTQTAGAPGSGWMSSGRGYMGSKS